MVCFPTGIFNALFNSTSFVFTLAIYIAEILTLICIIKYWRYLIFGTDAKLIRPDEIQASVIVPLSRRTVTWPNPKQSLHLRYSKPQVSCTVPRIDKLLCEARKIIFERNTLYSFVYGSTGGWHSTVIRHTDNVLWAVNRLQGISHRTKGFTVRILDVICFLA